MVVPSGRRSARTVPPWASAASRTGRGRARYLRPAGDEGLEQVLAQHLRYTAAGVCYGEHQGAATPGRAEDHAAAGWRVLQRVQHQIVERPFDPCGIQHRLAPGAARNFQHHAYGCGLLAEEGGAAREERSHLRLAQR